MSRKPDIDIETANMDELNQLRKWLFAEMLRLDNMRKSLEDEQELIQAQKGILKSQQRKNTIYKAQLDSQKALFEKQWALMEEELRKISIEKEQLERQKAIYRDEAYREVRKSLQIEELGSIFFKGVTDGPALKKRYKELLKIYHPDNADGDSVTVLAINKEYERLKRVYFE